MDCPEGSGHLSGIVPPPARDCARCARYFSRPPVRAISRHITEALRPVCTAISLFVRHIARHRDISSRSSSVSRQHCSPNGPSVIDRSAENLSKENQPQEDCDTSGKIQLSPKARLSSPLVIKLAERSFCKQAARMQLEQRTS